MAGTTPRHSRGDYVLTPSLRRKLKKPLGRLFPTVDVRGDEFLELILRAAFVVTVGDRVTETFQEATGRSPDVFVVDGMERRSAREVPRIAHGAVHKAKNPAGRITRAAVSAMRRAFAGDKPAMVLVEGEEDLLAITAVMDAPVGALVLYGQPLEGVVVVEVDAKAKERARETLRGMSG